MKWLALCLMAFTLPACGYNEVIDRDEQPDGINPTAIKSVIKNARDAGIACSRAQAVWCLKRTNGQEGLATDMITAQRSAKQALEVQCATDQLTPRVTKGCAASIDEWHSC